ncbi:hypothetical protein Tcan_07147 [Toxocara canis]|uniref:Uncharacterized protein n=1 Tax=Toxocara canis TaxID=6265 RepID=A0A0B2VK91_TOXCA|nr:hypothetical protein Tcan_07147 [Toxocara canis]
MTSRLYHPEDWQYARMTPFRMRLKFSPTSIRYCGIIEIPYIDADPLKLPHAITLSNALKSGVRGARNNSSRPKSMIDNCEELHGVEFTCINDNPLKKANAETNTSVASTGDQQLQGKNIFNECLTIHQNGTNPGLQRSESSNKSTQLTPLSTGGRQSQANIFDEFETIQPRRPLSEASCYDSS